MAKNTHFKPGVALRRLRLALCLTLPALALLSNALFTFRGVEGRAQKSSAGIAADVKVETVVTPALRRVIFTTTTGFKIFVNLPENLTPGETFSGTVFVEAPARPDALEELRGYVVEVVDRKIPATAKKFERFELNLAASELKAGTVAVALRDDKGRMVAHAELQVVSRPLSRPVGLQLPAFALSGDFLTVGCPCDGVIAETDFVKVGGASLLIVAESRASRVVFNDGLPVGPSAVEFGERGAVSKGTLHNLSLKMSAQKLSLMRGERTTLTVEVSGLEDLPEAAPLRLENRTPEVVRMEPADVQELSITPADVLPGGRYKTERTLTGIKPGTFRVEATVSRTEEQKAAAPPTGESPAPAQSTLPPGADAAASFESAQEWIRARDELIKKLQSGSFPAPPRPEVTLVSPELGATLKEVPTFRWRRPNELPPDVPKVYYTLRVFEVSQEQSRSEEIRNGKPVFEQSLLTEESFRLPSAKAVLTQGKVYAWGVTVTDQGGRELAQSKLSVFGLGPLPPFNFCLLFDLGPVSYCINQGTGVDVAVAIMTGPGSLTWTLTPQSGSDPPVSGSSSTIKIPPALLPTTPGPHTYTLTVTKGNCTRTTPVTINAYPGGAVGGSAVVSPTDICDGGTAVLDVQGETGAVGEWEYSDDGGATWNSATNAFFIAGAPANTNNMHPSSCPAPNWYTARLFRAVVSTSNDPNAPSCSTTYSAPTTLRIYCQPQAGALTADTTRFCIHSPSAPQNITLQLGGPVVGNVTWNLPSGPVTGGQSITVPAPSQTTTYTATISTGSSTANPCASITRSVTVVVDSQPFCASANALTADQTVVCPGDAAQLTVNNCQGYVTWQQSTVGPGGPWLPVSAGNVVQNTTDLFATTYWRAVISGFPGSGTTCPPFTTNPISVTVKPPPAAPSIPAPPIACLGSNVTLSTTPPPAGVTYQWYHDDMPVCGGGSSCVVPAEPGNYWVEASNGCQTVQSNFVTIPVDEITIKLNAPCCRTTGPVTLSAVATSSISGPIGASHFTWYQGGAVVATGVTSITVNPSSTSDYCVRVKSPNASCSATSCATITVCP